MEVEDTRFGENGVLFMADCGVIPEPTVEQLADIAVSTAQLARQFLGIRPRVALLSFSTKGSATHPSIGSVQAATALADKKAAAKKLEADFDGELQVDAALVPEIADAQIAGKQSRRPGERVDFSRPQFRQHRQQTGPARGARECLRPDSARPGSSRPPMFRAARMRTTFWASPPSSACNRSNITSSIPARAKPAGENESMPLIAVGNRRFSILPNSDS